MLQVDAKKYWMMTMGEKKETASPAKRLELRTWLVPVLPLIPIIELRNVPRYGKGLRWTTTGYMLIGLRCLPEYEDIFNPEVGSYDGSGPAIICRLRRINLKQPQGPAGNTAIFRPLEHGFLLFWYAPLHFCHLSRFLVEEHHIMRNDLCIAFANPSLHALYCTLSASSNDRTRKRVI